MIRRLLTLSLLIFFMGKATGQCDITNLTVVPFGCDDGLFYVELDFDIVNAEGNLFGVVGNATNYGLFPYDTLPLT
jgi:hypothetical protein